MITSGEDFSPWKGTDTRRLKDIPSTFLRWAARERPDLVDKHPGLRDYIAARLAAEERAVVPQRSPAGRVLPAARGRFAGGNTGAPKGVLPGVKRGAEEASKSGPDGGQVADLFAAMRRATE